MSLKLRWTQAAQRDLLDIWTWRGRERPELGDKILGRIETACRRLCVFPHLGPAMPRIGPDARKLVIDGFVALYRIDPQAIVIVRVLDQRRLLEGLTLEEG